jgi:hypothetical protein
MTDGNTLKITEDGVVYKIRHHDLDQRLGHVSCIVNDCECTRAPQSALDVRLWWRQLMESEEQIDHYVSTVQHNSTGGTSLHASMVMYEPEDLKDVLEEILPAA